jgi:hypothetical protein
MRIIKSEIESEELYKINSQFGKGATQPIPRSIDQSWWEWEEMP